MIGGGDGRPAASGGDGRPAASGGKDDGLAATGRTAARKEKQQQQGDSFHQRDLYSSIDPISAR